MNERNDIEFPVWRKKVDQSFLNDSATPIPMWLWEIWSLTELFKDVDSVKDHKSKVSIIFKNEVFDGNITFSVNKGRSSALCRLKIDKRLDANLKETFLMSYMRSLEGQIRKSKNLKVDIELEIPFWEFIDIEFNSSEKTFIFTPHFYQKPVFPELFNELVSSPSIKKVDDRINNKEINRIHKQDWKKRELYKSEIGAENVIYTLIDTKNKLIYIGEAEKLIARFDQGHPVISKWDYYKYNVLPDSLEVHRVAIERMAIRDMACFLDNNVDIPNIEISTYKLTNKKIDK